MEVAQLRRILSRRRHFVRICVMEINAAKYLCRGIGVRIEMALQTSEAWEKLAERSDVERLRGHLEMHARQWALAKEQVQQLERELDEALQPFGREMRLLTGVSGIGQITAATFIAVVGDPKRFADSSKLASYLGLTPSTYDSGESIRHGRITKAGSPAMRSLFCEASHHAARPSHFLYPYWSRMYARSGYKRAVVAVAHRLARILFQMWRKNEPFDLSKLNVEYHPVRKEKMVIYRLKAA
jgi:transposase